MNAGESAEQRVDRLVGWYGNGANGASPTRRQWHRIVSRSEDGPVTLVNFFKLRGRASYADAVAGADDTATGRDAFDRYAAVSMPTLEKVGGKFLLVAPFEGAFVGKEEDWDLVAVGSYPNGAAVLALFEDAGYRDAYPHRTAACERQKVFICPG